MKNLVEEIKYPIGIQNFAEIRKGGYLYIDKTSYIHRLFHGKYYFLSRPRRFGKSLLLSTMEAYYKGERELFEGLSLNSLTDDWEPHPVLHLDLNNGNFNSAHGLDELLDALFSEWEKEYDVNYNKNADKVSPSLRFRAIIKCAKEKTGKKVAILIDEYDKPLLSAVGDKALADSFRSTLKSVYSNLKSMDEYIEIGMITGVARFNKVSIFSDLNNLRDISFEEQFAGICGITSVELEKYCKQSIQDFARKESVSEEFMRNKLSDNYDGYHFSRVSPDIYNPFSLMNVFAKQCFGSYWFESGTPTYLVRQIEQEEWLLRNLAPTEIDSKKLESAGILSSDPIPALYQTGYLTIKGYDPVFHTYTLDYPNEEVRDGFISFLVPYYIKPDKSPGQFSIKKFIMAITSGDIETFMSLFASMIAGVPYSEKGSAEAHFQNASYILFTLMGQYVNIEDRTSDGRIDLTIETPQNVYILEFKVDSNSKEAMEQIHNKRYWLKFATSGKKIFLIGANFDSKTRRLEDYIVEEI
ncbi:MAG: ATP-binding protein [Muribaculaceae bacterium]|nr:ATP-binding protein [Muribaculaceae bacterium]